jgi:hypothetical protein
MNAETYRFLLKLKTFSPMWYGAVVACAQVSALKGKDCALGAVDSLVAANIPIDEAGVNYFEVAKAANTGILTDPSFGAGINSFYSKMHEEKILKKLQQEFSGKGWLL